MYLIFRLLAVIFGFFIASIVAGAIVVVAILYPDISALDVGLPDESAFNVLIGFGFIFVSGFALLPAAIIALITETFAIRHILVYALGGGAVGAACYLGLVPFDTTAWRFDGIVRRHFEVMTGAGIAAGFVYWAIAGRHAGLRRDPPRL